MNPLYVPNNVWKGCTPISFVLGLQTLTGLVLSCSAVIHLRACGHSFLIFTYLLLIVESHLHSIMVGYVVVVAVALALVAMLEIRGYVIGFHCHNHIPLLIQAGIHLILHIPHFIHDTKKKLPEGFSCISDSIKHSFRKQQST